MPAPSPYEIPGEDPTAPKPFDTVGYARAMYGQGRDVNVPIGTDAAAAREAALEARVSGSNILAPDTIVQPAGADTTSARPASGVIQPTAPRPAVQIAFAPDSSQYLPRWRNEGPSIASRNAPAVGTNAANAVLAAGGGLFAARQAYGRQQEALQRQSLGQEVSDRVTQNLLTMHNRNMPVGFADENLPEPTTVGESKAYG